MDQEEMQTFILGLESQELNARNRISEELARCEFEVQAKGLMMTSMIESFQETSENERQAEISAHKPPTTHRSEMSQATTACDSWINEVIRLTKRWWSKARRASQEEGLSDFHHRQEQIVSNPSHRWKELTHHHRHRDQQRLPMGAYSIDFYCSIGHAISCR